MKKMQNYIAFIVLLATGVNLIVSRVDTILQNNIASSFISVGVVSTGIYFLYLMWEKYLWKVKRLNRIIGFLVGFYVYPVLDGEWEITIESSFKNTQSLGKVFIKQDYANLYLENGEFPKSSVFESFFTTLKQKENGNWFLAYAYTSNPTILKKRNSFTMHEGFCYLNVINENKLEGYYHNDLNRKTGGKIIFVRTKTS